jgi:putative transposase
VSERHACRLLGQWRRTQRYAAIQSIDEDALTEAIIVLASESRSLRIPANYGAVAT